MDKSPDAFRTISEVAELLQTPAHVLRFWESRFPQIKPVKRAGGRRYYRPADMALLTGIRRLLHDEGMTIRGVQKILREQGVRHVSGLSEDEEADLADDFEELEEEQTVLSTEPIALFPARPHMRHMRHMRPQDVAVSEDDLAEGRSGIDAALPEMEHTTEAPINDSGANDAGLAPDAPPLPDIADGLFAGLGIDTGPPRPMPPGSAERRPAPSIQAPELPFDPPQPADLAESLGLDQPPEVTDESPIETPQASLPPSGVELAAEIDASAPLDTAEPPIAEVALAPMALDPAPEDDRPSPPTAIATDPALLAPPVTGQWLPAELRMLGKGALRGKTDAAASLAQRLEALRNRVGDLGRIPRR